jgi:imidazolonepropionase-like amidohydrolase
MELLNECGLTPMAVIVAATRNAARSLGMSDELGTLEATKLADVAILDADPLQRTSNIRQVSAILKDGMLIDVAQISVNEGVSRVG